MPDHEKDISKEEIELAALNIIIEAHTKQSLAIPAIMLRTMELDQHTNTTESEKEAHEIYSAILKQELNGIKLTTCRLAIAFLEAEITTQISNAQKNINQHKSPKTPPGSMSMFG